MISCFRMLCLGREQRTPLGTRWPGRGTWVDKDLALQLQLLQLKKIYMYITDASSCTYNLLIINNIYSIKDKLGSAFENNCNAVTVTLGHSAVYQWNTILPYLTITVITVIKTYNTCNTFPSKYYINNWYISSYK